VLLKTRPSSSLISTINNVYHFSFFESGKDRNLAQKELPGFFFDEVLSYSTVVKTLFTVVEISFTVVETLFTVIKIPFTVVEIPFTIVKILFTIANPIYLFIYPLSLCIFVPYLIKK
jgi:hypothetical protein